MKCPNCQSELTEGLSQCPQCGQPLSHNDNVDDPKLSLFTKIFIVVGLVALIGCGIIYYNMHKDDPEYTLTKIDPDSTLADQFDVKFATVRVDTANDEEKEEEKKASEVYNSIRRPAQEETAAEEVDIEDQPIQENTEGTEQTAPSTPAAPEAPAPTVESIE